MSLKFAVESVSDNHYVLPRVGRMKVEAHAFFSELYEHSEEAMWTQLAAASYEGVVGAYLMPDAHVGYGVPVGCVIVTDATIHQAGSGYDISCGIAYVKVPGLSAEDVSDWDRRAAWISEVEKRVATGVGSKRPPLAPEVSAAKGSDPALWSQGDRHRCRFVRASIHRRSRGRGSQEHRSGVPKGGPAAWLRRRRQPLRRNAGRSRHGRGLGDGPLRVPQLRLANREPFFLRRRRASWVAEEPTRGRVDEPLGRAYWVHHNSAANYAVANRHLIVRGIDEALCEVFGVESEVYYEISHNLVQEETLALPDGTRKRGFVHRKGATRAFPAGHPDLVGTPWEGTGHPCLIPGSMFAGAAILFALPGAAQSGFSVNHGSGRHMARGAAKRLLEPEQGRIDREMREIERDFAGVEIKGIVGNTERTPLDECGRVYKDLDEVLAVLENEGIARVAHRLYPVANIKGME